MRKIQPKHFIDITVDLSSGFRIDDGYALGQTIHFNDTGSEYLHKSDGIWEIQTGKEDVGVAQELIDNLDVASTVNSVINEYTDTNDISSSEILLNNNTKTSVTSITNLIKLNDHYRYDQGMPSDTWVIVHNLGRNPSVSIEDSAGMNVEGEVTYNDKNTLTVIFSYSFSGYADLN
jgi:hypothetical protein